MIDLEAIGHRQRGAATEGFRYGRLVTVITEDIPALIAEVRRLQRVIHDMGLPDANDFPKKEVPQAPHHPFGEPL